MHASAQDCHGGTGDQERATDRHLGVQRIPLGFCRILPLCSRVDPGAQSTERKHHASDHARGPGVVDVGDRAARDLLLPILGAYVQEAMVATNDFGFGDLAASLVDGRGGTAT